METATSEVPPVDAVVTTTPTQAAFSGNTDALSALLDAGGAEAATTADPVSGMTPLLLAALKGHLSCVTQLIDAAPEALNATDTLGRTALMLAATGGSVETIQLLHKHGAQLDVVSRDGRTALIWAVIAHKFGAVEVLALLGADPDVRELEGSGLIKPGGEDPPKSAFDHANARHGKDPVLGHIRGYLKSWLEAREAGTATPRMAQPGWIEHAKQVAAGEEEEERVAEVSTGGGAADNCDIWDEGDEAAGEAVASPGETVVAVEAGVAVEGFTPCVNFGGARPGEVFKKGELGTGYYAEPTATTTSAVPVGEAVAEKKETAAATTPPSNLDELD